MTFKAYLWGMRLLVLVFAAAFVSVLICVDPENSKDVALSLFYLTLFLFLASFFNLFFLFFRRKLAGNDQAQLAAASSFRQGTLLSVLAISLLVLQSFQMLVWWDGLLVVAGVFLIELYFISRN